MRTLIYLVTLVAVLCTAGCRTWCGNCCTTGYGPTGTCATTHAAPLTDAPLFAGGATTNYR